MKTYQDYLTAANAEILKAREYDKLAEDCEYGTSAQQFLRENAEDCRTLARRFSKLAEAKKF